MQTTFGKVDQHENEAVPNRILCRGGSALAWLLAAMTASSMALTACGGGASSEVSKENSNPPAQSSTAQAEPTIHKLKLLGAHNGGEIWDNRENYDVWGIWQEMLKENNLELEYEMVTGEQYPTVIQTRMSSGSNLPDIANVSPLDDAMLLGLAKQGVILELNSLLNQYSNGNVEAMYRDTYPFANGLVLTADGNRYWTTNLYVKTYQKKDLANTGLTLMVRGDWLDSLKLDVPTTLDEFTQTLRTFREKDPNGTGTADEILNLKVQTFQNGLAQCFGLGADVVSIDPNNRAVVSPWYQDGAKAYFAYVQSLVSEGIIDPALIGSSEVANQRTAENKVGAFFSYGMDGWTQKKIADVENAHFQPLMPLTGAAEGITPYAVVEPGELCWNRYVITKGCKDVEGAVKLLDLFYSQEYRQMMCWGVEGDYSETKDGITSKIKYEEGQNQRDGKIFGNGEQIFGDYIPNLRIFYLDAELEGNRPAKPKAVAYQEQVNSYPYWYTNMNGNYLAVATDEEAEQMSTLATAINTYSQELCTKLSLGQASLDDWDSYIAEFDKMGLKDLMQIYEDRMNRYFDFRK